MGEGGESLARRLRSLETHLEAQGARSLAGNTISMDFTETTWSTKDECGYMGLRFSDYDTPFPTTLAQTVSGSWAHSAGNGWYATSTSDLQGPAILLPLAQPSNWQLDIGLTYADTAASLQGFINYGYITQSAHMGAYVSTRDVSTSTVELQTFLSTNDGDDTYTIQYAGAVLSGSGARTYKFRCLYGTVGVWDDYDDDWHNYSDRHSIGHAYTPACAYVQFRKQTSVDFWTAMYLTSLKLAYLV
jgi:hypothetical protein